MPRFAVDDVMTATQGAPLGVGGLIEILATLGALIPEVLILNFAL